MPRGFFVTGTVTGVGKTWVSLALLRRFQMRGLRVMGMKPVATGCERRDGRLVNADARLLQEHSSAQVRYEDVNPYAFEPPIAPKLAASEAGRRIDLGHIAAAHGRLLHHGTVTIVEGVGGWLVPLDDDHTVADLALRLGLPVVVVVAVRLGCLNHALLSVESIRMYGATLAGWVAIPFPGTSRTRDIVRALQDRIAAPCFGQLPWLPALDVVRLARHLHLPGQLG